MPGSCITNPIYFWVDTDTTLSDCYNNNWLNDNSDYQWTLTPTDNPNYLIVSIHINGNIFLTSAYHRNSTRPTTYLKSSVKIISGNGEISNPYVLSL